jgi:phosphohistidine phosphatase
MMKLLVIRHGIAMDRDEFAESGQPDDLRPLTEEGRRKMKDIAKWLRKKVKDVDILATSPLLRARQTAEIVADEFGIEKPEMTDALVPDSSFEDFEQWCALYADKKVVAIVGHEPHLSLLVTWFISGKRESRVELKKGGACLIDFESGAHHDSGTLSWLVTPRQMVK